MTERFVCPRRRRARSSSSVIKGNAKSLAMASRHYGSTRRVDSRCARSRHHAPLFELTGGSNLDRDERIKLFWECSRHGGGMSNEVEMKILRVTWRERCANVGHVAGASSDKNHESNITTDRSCILAKEKRAAKNYD